MTDSSEPTPRQAPRPSRSEVWAGLPRWVRRSTTLGVVLVLALVAAGYGAVSTVRASHPRTSGEVVLGVLDGEATIARDDDGLPTIEAGSTRDLFAAQGYAAAQDRFYAMDVARRYAAGTLAEIWGEPALAGDKLVRTLGWRRSAQSELALLDVGTIAALQAYAEGVNAWLAEREGADLGIEYVMLEGDGLAITPQPWQPVDSLAVVKAWAWSMGESAEREVESALLAPRQSPAEIAELFPPYDLERHPPVVQGGGVVDGVFEPAASGSGSRAPRRAAPSWAVQGGAGVREVGDLDLGPAGPGAGRSIFPGGTAVAVAGDLTASGAPLLVADVIDAVSLPGPLSQVTLRCVERSRVCDYDVAGFALTGVPGVIAGRTDSLAWSLTSFRADTTDLFLERVRGQSYVRDGVVLPLTRRDETVVVAGGDPFTFTVRSTGHGPLVSDVSPELSTVAANAVDTVEPGRLLSRSGPGAASLLDSSPNAGYALSLQWTGAVPGRTMDGLLAMNRARDGEGLREAAELLAAPTVGIAWADEASIGYQAAGVVPVRGNDNDGREVAAGWRAAAAWRPEPVPYAALPHTEDPDAGFVVAADQAVVGEDYPYDLGHAWDAGYRSSRLTDRISGLLDEGPLRTRGLRAAFSDTFDPLAPTLSPLLQQVLQTTAYASTGQDQLAVWDGRNTAGSPGAAYYQAVTRRILRLTFDDEVRSSMAPAGGSRWTAVLEELIEDPTSRWWDDVDTPQLETRETVLAAAERAAVDDLVRLQARDPRAWTWGHQHQLRLEVEGTDALASGLTRWLLEVDPVDLGGDGSTVLGTAWDPQDDFEVTSAPVARFDVDLASDAGAWIASTGVSGRVWSPHLVDQTEVWARGDRLAWRFGAPVSGEVLRLRPAG